MKTISAAQWQTLEDLSAEGLLGGLPLQTAEKDIHVTDVLARLETLQVRHAHFKGLARGEVTRIDDGIELVFAGGTCLSKAHGLISRMSEDIDIKVVLNTPTNGELKTSVGTRARLIALHGAITEVLLEMQFDTQRKVNGRDNPQIRDGHRYFVVGSQYGSRAPPVTSLRPELKLELIHREPQLPPSRMEFGYLHERLATLPIERPVTIQCIQVAETLAEKVLSLLRRCAWNWGGHQEEEMDAALVRHVYDVHRIMELRPKELSAAEDIFESLVQGDALEFGGRDPGFDRYPKETLMKTLTTAKASTELQQRYVEQLLPLIYDGAAVPYSVAFAGFEAAANRLIARL